MINTFLLAEVGPGDGVGAFVEVAGEGIVIHDVPDAVGDFFEADVLVIESLTEEVLARMQVERSGSAHFTDLKVTGVFGGRGNRRFLSIAVLTMF